MDQHAEDEPLFNDDITIFEIRKAVQDVKAHKASGFDQIPSEVFKNDAAVSVAHVIFNQCYKTGKIPTDLGKGIIHPIPKSSATDRRDPLSYRGITLAPSMYKLYCSILNRRLTVWAESNFKINEEQNGFRKGMSTVDHLSSLTSIIEARQKKKLPIYCASKRHTIVLTKAFSGTGSDKLESMVYYFNLSNKHYTHLSNHVLGLIIH